MDERFDQAPHKLSERPRVSKVPLTPRRVLGRFRRFLVYVALGGCAVDPVAIVKPLYPWEPRDLMMAARGTR